ncbi:nonstructural protein [Microviridae sp.]|nr:nonstructural protein [Microviridae sp.]
MIHQMFTVLDDKAAAYIQPFFAPTIEHAKRTFKDTCNDTDHAFYRNPDDYTLVHIGEYDDNSACLHPLDKPTTIITAREYRNTQLKIAKG